MGIITDLIGGSSGASASKKAAKAQVQAAQIAADTQKDIFGQIVKLQGPQLQAGTTATNRYLTLLGLQPAQPTNATTAPASNNAMAPITGFGPFNPIANGIVAQNTPTSASGLDVPNYNLSVDPNSPDFGKYAHDFSMTDFQEDPGYAFRFDEGLKALQRSFAAKGQYLSGPMVKGAQRYGQDMASQEYTNAFNRYQINRSNQLNPLQTLMGQGQTSVNQLSSSAQNAGNQISDLQTQQGNARASGYIGAASSWNNALSNINNSLTSAAMMFA